jgi:ParB-like chromosome segregation protein Spo0J
MKLNEIKLNESLQSRISISDEVVDEYTEVLREGGKLPAVTIYRVGSVHYLVDGWHRYHAHKKAGLADIQVDVIDGTLREATLYSVGVNDSHGLRRSNEDKRKAVQTLLDDMEWAEWSDREIAKACKVSHPTVSRLRTNRPSEVKVMRGDKEFTMNVDNLKVSDAPKKEQEYEFEEDNLKEMASTIDDLSKELERAELRIAVAAMEATDEEKGLAQTKFVEMEAKITTLERELSQAKISRDSYMIENGELKKQIKALEKQIYAMRKQYEVA